jgi:phosphoribosylformylglycinamidine synthase PurS subunit
MKVSVLVRQKQEVLDPEGDAVRRVLMTMGFAGVRQVRVGKLIEMELDDTLDPEARRTLLVKMCDELLANPVIEDYEIRDS